MNAPGVSKVRLALVVAAIFVAGGASGYALRASLRPAHGHHRGSPPWLRELDLSEEQRVKADSIFNQHRADVEVIMRDALPKVRARNEQMEQELRAILNPDQAKKLDAIRARRPPFPPGGAPGLFDGPPPPPDRAP